MMFVSLGLGTALAVIAIAVVSVVTGGSPSATSSTSAPPALVGARVAPFTLPGLAGGTITPPWRDHHPAILIFFASWCGPCQGEMPAVARYLRDHRVAPVRVIGVDANDQRTAAGQFVARDHVTFPVGFDANGVVTSQVFHFITLPETVFVNARGVVTGVHFGAIPVAQLASGVRTLTAGSQS